MVYSEDSDSFGGGCDTNLLLCESSPSRLPIIQRRDTPNGSHLPVMEVVNKKLVLDAKTSYSILQQSVLYDSSELA